MNKILAKIDSLIDKIPIHIRDLIQKGFYSIVALAALIAIIVGIKKGMDNAKPGGIQLFGKNKDMFYIQRLREENSKKNKLIEDIDVYDDLFESRDERLHPTFHRLGRDTDDRLIGEREEFIKNDPLRKKQRDFLIEEKENFSEVEALPDKIEKKPVSVDDVPLIENEDAKHHEKRLKRAEKPEKAEKAENPVKEEFKKSTLKEDTNSLKLLD